MQLSQFRYFRISFPEEMWLSSCPMTNHHPLLRHHSRRPPLAVAAAPSPALPWSRQRVLGKRPRQRLLAAHLLAAHKAVNRNRDRPVNVLRRAVL